MKIYTRQGDRGRTALFGGGRVPKSDSRVDAYGTVDELNATIGLALALDDAGTVDGEGLAAVQADLFAVGAHLAAARPDRALERGSIPALPASRVKDLEDWIDELDAELSPLDAFILPGGSPVGAQLHVARTVCRRAERRIVAILEERPDLEETVVPYMNRLSDLLFTLARDANRRAGRSEREWRPRTRRGAEADRGGADRGGADREGRQAPSGPEEG